MHWGKLEEKEIIGVEISENASWRKWIRFKKQKCQRRKLEADTQIEEIKYAK